MDAPSSKDSSSGRGTSAVAGHAVDDEARAAELGPADAAVLAAPAALVVMVHDARANGSEVRRHTGPGRGHDAAGLVARNDRAAAAEPEGCRGIARGPVGMQVAAAHARGLDGENDLARAGRGVRKVLQLELPLSEKNDAAQVVVPPVEFYQAANRPLTLPSPPRRGRGIKREGRAYVRRPQGQ